MKRLITLVIVLLLWAGSSWAQNIFFEGFESGNTQDLPIVGWTQESIIGTQVWSANTSLTTYNRTPRTGSWNSYLRYSNTDWMFKSVTLTSGTNYILSFYARQDVTTGCNILASYGTTGSAAGMTNPIILSTAVTNGGYQYFSGTFTPATSETFYIGIRADLTSAPWYISIDDISLDVLAAVPPNCANIVSPTDATTNVPPSATLNWVSGGGAPTGYKLYFGTDNPPTDIVNGTDLGNVTTYNPNPDLSYSIPYYWKVVPYNAYGDATGCPIWSFTTMADPTVTTFPYNEGFEAAWVSTPSAPPGWTQITVSGTNVWNRSTTSPHSGTYCALAPWVSAGGEHLLITPPLNLTSLDYRLKFWLKGSSSAGTNLKVQIATSNSLASNFTTDLAYYVAGTNMPTAWTEQTIDLSAYENIQFIAFRMIDANGYSLYIDDVTVEIPPPPLNGIKTIKSSGGDYSTFTEAINALNNAGVGSGGVTFNVDADLVSIEDCPVITATGTASNPIVFQKSGSGANPVIKPTGGSGTTDAGIAIGGGDYITFDGIDIMINSGSAVEYGYYIRNASSTDGAQYNTIKNSKINLNRSNTSSRGIYQYTAVTPTNQTTGNNNNNKYYNITIENVYVGIYLYGYSATYFDSGCEIGVVGGGNTVIGSSTSNDIGNGSTAVYGIRASYQSGVKIFNATIRNVTCTSSSNRSSGIFVENSYGTSGVYNNIIGPVTSSSTTSSTTNYLVSGMRLDVASGATVNVYNNFIFGITSSQTSATSSAPSSVIQATGIVMGVTVGTSSLYFNSIRIETSSNINSSCVTSTGNQANTMRFKDNIFANMTPAQTGTPKHYCIMRQGSSGTINTSDYNDFYIANSGNGFVGYYTADQATLANWQSTLSQDANSKDKDPVFLSSTNLHSSSSDLNGAGVNISIANGDALDITTDIDGATRGTPPDIGADEFDVSSIDMGATALVAPVATGCFTSTETVTVTIKNYGVSTIDFITDPVTVTTNVSGAVTQSLSATVNSGTLASGATQNVNMSTTLDMTAPGTYTFNASTSVSGDGNAANDAMPPVNRAILPPSAQTVTNITTVGATLGWTSIDSFFDIFIQGTATPPPGPTTTPTVDENAGNVLTWTGGSANNTFYWWVRTDCDGTGGSNESTWTGPSSFYTGYCIPAPTSVDGNGITNVTFSTVNNTTGAEPGNYGDYSAMVGNVQQTATVPVSITFQTGYTYVTKIWIDWNDNLSFLDAGDEVYSGESTANNPTTLAASFVVPGTASLGNHRMRIGSADTGPPTPCYTGSYGSYEDYTVNVTAAPACPAPTALTVTEITSTSAKLGWTENGTATKWNIEYGTAGFTLGTGTPITGVTTNPYLLTGLTPNAPYDFYVQADCSAARETSDWAGPKTFTTNPLPYTLPFTEAFTSTTALPAGWRSWQSEGTGRSWTATSGGYTSGCAYSGFYGTIWLISNEITVPSGGSVDLDFYQKNTWVADYEKHGLYYSTTGAENEGDWTAIVSDLGVAPETWTKSSTYTISGYPGTILYIAFKYEGSNADGWYIDDVHMEITPTCLPPVPPTITGVTQTSATVNLMGARDIDSFFDVFIDIPPTTPGSGGTTVTGLSSGESHTFTDLAPGTLYDVYLRKDCGFTPDRKLDNFWMVMDDPGNLVNGAGTIGDDGETGQWLEYEYAPGSFDWWNVWFYNGPFVQENMKKIRLGFWIQQINPELPSEVYYVINWTTPAWDPPEPAFPIDTQEEFIRRSPVNYTQVTESGTGYQWVELSYCIYDYNPSWVSVDIWGKNIRIPEGGSSTMGLELLEGSLLYEYWVPGMMGGIIVHECLPKGDNNTTSQWTGPVSFTTLLSCDPPANPVMSDITPSSVSLSWTPPPDYPAESFFDVFFGPGSDPFDGIITTTANSTLTVEGLAPATQYSWTVRTHCPEYFEPDVDRFYLTMLDPEIINPALSGGTADEPEKGEDGLWRHYINAPGDIDWWNIWFYNQPFDPDRMKKIRMAFYLQKINEADPSEINYVINWSTPDWAGSGYPSPDDEAFIMRSPVNIVAVAPGPFEGQWIEFYYEIPDYNPEWISVDIWGTNIQIVQSLGGPPPPPPYQTYWQSGMPGGVIIHECLPKPDGNNSGWLIPLEFWTEPGCPPPTDPVTSDIGQTSVRVGWTPPPDFPAESFFDVFVDIDPDPTDGAAYTTITSTLEIMDLEPGTDYYWGVRTHCSEFLSPALDAFYVAFDQDGNFVDDPGSSGGSHDDPGEDGIWWEYVDAPGPINWWNIWFYNGMFIPDNMKNIRMAFYLKKMIEGEPAEINYVINWSTPGWTGPGYPMPDDEAFIMRSPVNSVDFEAGTPIDQWIELFYQILDYNPQWISVDIWGKNIQIVQNLPSGPPPPAPLVPYWDILGKPGGFIVHECLPKPDGNNSSLLGPVPFTTLCGTYDIPYTQNFDSKTAPAIPNCVTVTNDNGDGEEWLTYDDAGRSLPNGIAVIYNFTQAMDDWFFTGALNLRGGVSYDVSFYLEAPGWDGTPERLEVKWGTGPSAAGMTGGTIFSTTTNLYPTYTLIQGSFTPAINGVYYVGWHGFSVANVDYILVDDILIESVFTWTAGAGTTDWNTAGNWSQNKVPDATSKVIIPEHPTGGFGDIFPVLPGSGTFWCHDITIGLNATLIIPGGATLEIMKP